METLSFVDRRRQSIGGSDAAAIVGLHPFLSKQRVWAEKIGKIPPKMDSESMRQGRDLEDYVARRFIEHTGISVDFTNQFSVNPLYPFAHANLDRKVVGQNAGLECKTTSSLNLKKFKNGEYPAQYYVQCVHYMAVEGLDRMYLAVLVLGRAFYVFVIDRDEEEIRWLMNEERIFWENYVQTEVPPPGDGSEDATDAIGEVYADAEDVCVPLVDREELIKEYLDVTARTKALERRAEEIKQTIMLDLKEASRGSCGPYRVSWTPQSRATIDQTALSLAYPDINLDDYRKVSKFRRFTIKEVKK
jgi:putative phage-type endonuclease